MGYACDHPPFQQDILTAETDEVSVYDVLEKGLQDLADLCDVVIDKFTIAREEFNAANPRAEVAA